ncbi:MAG: hypothetical protein GDA51_13445 [Ekhidna sp.]|nr:hypothetical protein [Ekhidna sp.]MBC6427436.1 hypothetical protein [Ekhidna sp.]
MKNFFAGLLAVTLTCSLSYGQSIYSFEGLGSLEHQGMPNNFGMGEAGIGAPTAWHVNTQNPAHLVYNQFSTFQTGIELENRRFSGQDISGTDTNGSLRFLGYAFPIMPGKWSSSIGILPYSTVNYNTFSEGTIEGVESVNQVSDDRGEGGLTNFYWSNGFRIKKKLMIGVRANFTFGSIEKESVTSIIGADVPVSIVNSQNQESYTDLNFLIGLGYRYDFTEKTFLNFGLVYAPQSRLNGTSTLSWVRLSTTGSELDIQNLGANDIEQDLPETLGFGLSYQKLNNYTVGLDIETQGWEAAQNENQTFTDLFKVAIGIEWTPDYDNVSSYFKRVKYSLGFNRTKLPYIINEQSLIDFGINFSASLPVSGFSSLDLAFKLGQLGETGNGLIKENYFNIIIGATINDRWFVQRRYD